MNLFNSEIPPNPRVAALPSNVFPCIIQEHQGMTTQGQSVQQVKENQTKNNPTATMNMNMNQTKEDHSSKKHASENVSKEEGTAVIHSSLAFQLSGQTSNVEALPNISQNNILQEGTQLAIPKSTLPGDPQNESLTLTNQKRAAPTAEIFLQPQAKKSMAFQVSQQDFESTNPELGPSIFQYDLRAPTPYAINLNAQQNTKFSANKGLQEQSSILGASPTTVHHSSYGNKRRPSGWDVEPYTQQRNQPQGTTRYKPGAATWKRYGNTSHSGSGRNNRNQIAIPQDIQQGGFSPPPMAREYYVGVDGCVGSDAAGSQTNVQGQVQLGTPSNDATQTMCEDSGRANVEMDFEAAAPAFKAPRVP
jgi:hypothetical protein